MSTTQYTDIRGALAARLHALEPGIVVAWENFSYTPVAGVPYLVPTMLWGEGVQAELGETGRNWETGIYQLMLCNIPEGEGINSLNTLAGTLRNHFKRGTTLVYNGVTVTVRKVYLTHNILSIAFYTQVAN